MAGASPRGWSPRRVTLLSSALFIPLWARKLKPPRQPPPSSWAASSSRMDTAEEQRELSPMATSTGVCLIQAGGVADVPAVPRQRLGRFQVHWRLCKQLRHWRELCKHKTSRIISSFLTCLWVLDSLCILHLFWNNKYHHEPGCPSTDSSCCFKEDECRQLLFPWNACSLPVCLYEKYLGKPNT